MKSLTLALVIAAGPTLAADVGITINLGQPGFYGQINIGSDLVPRLLYPQPVIIAPPPVAVVLTPLYLRVPPDHARNWGKHCFQYNACGRQVYFVDDDWYEKVYVPNYRGSQNYHREDHEDGDHDDHDHGKHGRGHGHGHGHDDE